MKLTHYFGRRGKGGKPVDKWKLEHGGATLIETGSSVLVVRKLRECGLKLPENLVGPGFFVSEWTCEWKAKGAKS